MVSGFREIHVPRAWRVYSATGFDFREKKNRASLGSIGATTLSSASYLATILCREDIANYFSRNFVCILRTTTRLMVSFIDFYFHFLPNFQT